MTEVGELSEIATTSSTQDSVADGQENEDEIIRKPLEEFEMLSSTTCATDDPTASTSTLKNLASTSAIVNATEDDPVISIADMIRETVNDFFREYYLPGFEFNDQYQLYYNSETGYYYDQNTSLFYYPPTQCYYYYDEQTESYVFHSRVPAEQAWNVPGAKKHAFSIFGKSFTLGMGQDEVDVFECVHELIESARDLDEGEIESDEQSDIDSSSKESDDEIQQMIQHERLEHAPCIRLIDMLTAQLNIITIAGATVGGAPHCDVHLLSGDSFPEECAKVQYEEAENQYKVSSVQQDCPVIVNDVPLGVEERRAVEHGDVWKIGRHMLVAHIHHGDNTCSGCEPGLLTASDKGTENVRVVPKRSSESLRRHNVRLMKAQYGLLEDETSKYDSSSGYNGSMREKRNQRPRLPPRIGHEDGSIYSHCEAKPKPGSSVESVVMRTRPAPQKAIDDTNKGYKLLCGMGWKEGTGLGRTHSGIKEPIINEQRSGRAGLGSKQEKPAKKAEPPAKIRILQITKERFSQKREVCFEDVFRDHCLQ